MFPKIFLTVYGLFLLTGAYFGWKAGSKISLVMGLVSGACVLLSVYLATTQAKLGFTLLSIISGFLTVTFLLRFLKTHHMMPSGMLLLLSLVAFCVSIIQVIKK